MAGLFEPRRYPPPSLLEAAIAKRRRSLLGDVLLAQAPVKRRAFFSFHFDDIMRVNNVRNAWRFYNPDTILSPSFTDSSLWESKQLEGPDALKRLIREGVEHTSAVCVLVGTETWLRRWVKYEIARAVIDNRGLLAVHLNSLNHHMRRAPDFRGQNPLAYMAVGKERDGSFRLYEKVIVPRNILSGQYDWEWRQYADYMLPVGLPKYLPEPQVGWVMPLSAGTREYCFVADDGSKKIGGWIDLAAQAVGR